MLHSFFLSAELESVAIGWKPTRFRPPRKQKPVPAPRTTALAKRSSLRSHSDSGSPPSRLKRSDLDMARGMPSRCTSGSALAALESASSSGRSAGSRRSTPFAMAPASPHGRSQELELPQGPAAAWDRFTVCDSKFSYKMTCRTADANGRSTGNGPSAALSRLS